MAKGKSYNREFQLQTCRLVVEQGYSLKEASERLGPCTWTIREWIKKYRTRGELPGADQVVPEAEELKRLRKENKQLQMENIKKSGGVLCQRQPVRYAWIREHAAAYPKTVMFRALQVSAGGYYAWTKRKPSKRHMRQASLAESVKKFHARSRQVYGYRKVHEDLIQEEGHSCSAELVRRVMRKNGLKSKVKGKFITTTDSAHAYVVAPNRLARNFSASTQNQKWVGDITYIRTYEGWLYLCIVQDLYSRRIVGWAMSETINSALVCAALKMALQQRRPQPGLLFHSDRGVQYAADEYQELLRRNKALCSMSRKGDCWDNACAESFFSRLKGEHIQDRVYATRDEACQEVFWYIEVFYNRSRRHAALGYVSPVDFEEKKLGEKAA